MRNLAGQTTAHANAYVEDELTEACIPIADSGDSKGEVKATLQGEYENCTFRRAWYYWVVRCHVPIELAWELYNDPRGRNDVRVAGHCGCPEPIAPWVVTIDGEQFVVEYHIDSQDGLNLFAEKVLGTRPLPPTEEEKEAAKQAARENTSGGRVLYEDSLSEEDYLAAAQEVREIRSGLSDLRRRLEDLGRGPDKGMIPTDSIATTAAGSLTTIISFLYELEDPSQGRSFPARATGIKELWNDLYANPLRSQGEDR